MESIMASKLLAGLVPEGFVREDTAITLVTTDSRELCPGCVFVAFPGARFDGHDFAAEALRRGAAYVVLNHPVEGVPDEKAVLCPDSYRAMMTMGANYRAQYTPTIVGVTGSVGKTTTKEFCYAVLQAFGNAVKTEGNQNNELGLPRTLFRLARDTEYAVVEMGMSHAGEIERLARCARPSAGVITCIGVSHIENLGSRENICKAKLELCAGLPEGAPLVLNYDDAYLRAAHLPAHVRPVWYSLGDEEADVWASDITQTEDGGMAFLLEDPEHGRFPVKIPALGRHNVANALAAYCVATRLGLDARRAVAALGEFQQTGMRQHVVQHGGVTVIEDCYNANPDSMRAALAMFRDYPCKRRFALLGDMLELGDISRDAHEELGRLAAESGLYCLITYGEQAHRTAITAAARGLKTLYAQSYREAADALLNRVQPGDAILVKASRGIALEKALEIFYAEHK
jgi:UDP-N-acetylmuramoyl-tripeptide--D-alanyl-D-alanine ligase